MFGPPIISTQMTLQDVEKVDNNRVRLFVDAHVHIHDCFDVQNFLDAAARNFSHYAAITGAESECKYVLCLTETFGTNRFESLAKAPHDSLPNRSAWTFKPSREKECLTACHPDHGEIAIVAGRQIVTAERLEILGLGLLGTVEDGLPIADVVKLVADRGAIPVLPWGFGKWLGTRREVVEKLLGNVGDALLYLGDNSGRPRLLSEPVEFSSATSLGMRILPGSDPLPFASEFDRAGSFGFYVDRVENGDGIWTELLTMLQRGEGDLHHYGSLESPLRFVRNQVAMQYVTRVKNRRAAD